MSRLDVLYSSKSDEWSTPKALFDELNEEFGFTLMADFGAMRTASCCKLDQ